MIILIREINNEGVKAEEAVKMLQGKLRDAAMNLPVYRSVEQVLATLTQPQVRYAYVNQIKQSLSMMTIWQARNK